MIEIRHPAVDLIDSDEPRVGLKPGEDVHDRSRITLWSPQAQTAPYRRVIAIGGAGGGRRASRTSGRGRAFGRPARSDRRRHRRR
jgi:hypothetical protein